MNLMKIDNCLFPEDLLYDVENFVWADVKAKNAVTIGITALLSSVSGRISAIKIKDIGTQIENGKALRLSKAVNTLDLSVRRSRAGSSR